MRAHLLRGRSRVLVLAILAVLTAMLGLGLVAAPAMAAPGDQVCGPLTSGKIDTTGDPLTVTITAPAGQLITSYCVKAGSANQGDGPVYVTLAQPVSSLTIAYPGGKAISHYSYALTAAPTPVALAALPTLVDECGPGYALTVPPGTAGYAFSTDVSGAPGGAGVVVVTATLAAGHVWTDGTTTPRSWSFAVTNAPCVQHVPEPPAPSLHDVCGVGYEPTLPADTAAYAYSVDASGVVDGVGTVVVRATLAAGYAWQDGTTTPRSWSFPVTAAPCVEQAPEPQAPVVHDACGVAYLLDVPADTGAYAYSVDESGVVDGEGVVVVTATLAAGMQWSDGSTAPREWRLPVSADDCEVESIAAPTFLEVCGPDGETPYVLPAAGEHHAYVVDDPGTYVDGRRVIVVTAVLDEGWVAPEGAQTSWTRTLHDAPCDVPAAAAAAAVVVTPGTCDAPGSVEPGAIEHATWQSGDEPDEQGAHAGEVVLVAHADEGASFDVDLSGVSEDGTTRTFVVQVPPADPRLCPETPPVTRPDASGAPTPPAVDRVIAPAPRAQAPHVAAATLPRTGSDPSALLALGALLALAGAGLVVQRRRRG